MWLNSSKCISNTTNSTHTVLSVAKTCYKDLYGLHDSRLRYGVKILILKCLKTVFKKVAEFASQATSPIFLKILPWILTLFHYSKHFLQFLI